MSKRFWPPSTNRRRSRRSGQSQHRGRCFRPVVERLESRQLLSVFTVTNRNVLGAGSLWQALTDANANPGNDTIEFHIGTGPAIIPLNGFQVGSHQEDRLPNITDSVTIDATTQPGYAGTPLIELDGGALAPALWGLRVSAPNSIIRGLAIVRCFGNSAGVGIIVEATASQTTIEKNVVGTDANNASGLGNTGGVILSSNNNVIRNNVFSGNGNGFPQPALSVSGTGNVVQGNFIGTNVSGTARLANVFGLRVSGSDNTIGGTTPGTRNIISGNSAGAGFVVSGSNNRILGNYIGTDLTGTVALGNAGGGMDVTGGNNTITGNLISGNAAGSDGGFNLLTGDGIRISGTTNTIQNNRIGTDVTGRLALPNSDAGIRIDGSSNVIGGKTAGTGNTIAFNGQAGILVNPSVTNISNAFLSNQIFGNGGLGIDLGGNGVTPNDNNDADTGANKLQNFPVISSAVLQSAMLKMTYAVASNPSNSTYPLRVEFFKADATGQGRTFVGSDTYSAEDFTAVSKIASFTPVSPVVAGDKIVATATDSTATGASANTSEFSASIALAVIDPWHNLVKPLDVDGNGRVVVKDAMGVINYLNSFGPGPVPASAASGPPFYDTSGDTLISALDALNVINALNSGQVGAGAANEASTQLAAGSLAQSVVPSPVDLLLLGAMDSPPRRRK